jgi:hypothetical protein
LSQSKRHLQSLINRSPAVESLRRFGHLVMERVKRRKSGTPGTVAVPLAKARELPPIPLESFCKRPREFARVKPWADAEESAGRVVSGKLLEESGVRRKMTREMGKDRWLVWGEKGGFFFRLINVKKIIFNDTLILKIV